MKFKAEMIGPDGASDSMWVQIKGTGVAHGTDLRLGLVVGRLARGDGAGREQRDAVLWPRKEFQSEEPEGGGPG